jgi:hypothetical protein
MRVLRGEDGAALVTALMLTMLSLVIAMALLYSVTTGTRISASQKRYRSALAAAHGGVELLTREIIPKLFQLDPLSAEESLVTDFNLIDLHLPGYSTGCLQQKLNSPTAAWSSCSEAQSSADPARSPDMTFTLKNNLASNPDFRVSTKIVDTVAGNSDKADLPDLDLGSSVAGGGEGSVIHPQHIPAMYSIAVQGVGGNAREKATLSVLYAY